MLLKSITFTNFRCFKGTSFIDLSTDTKRNVIVMLGDNSHGKSTIVQAFAWCFYGSVNYDNPEIYNRALAEDLLVGEKTRASVEVVFEHEITNDTDGTISTVIYTAKRYQDFYRYNDGAIHAKDSVFSLSYKDPYNGVETKCGLRPNELSNAMNSIIHSDLASYFFFAGEKDHKLTTKSLSNAVRSLMGIDVLVKMREYLRGNTKDIATNSVLGIYEREQVSADNTKAQEEWKKKEAAEHEIEALEVEIEEIEKDILLYEDKKEKINQILREAAPSKEIQKRRDDIARSIKAEEAHLNKAYVNFLNNFSDKSANLLTYPLLNAAREKLKAMDLSDKGIKGIEVAAIYELLNRGYCLCGTELKEGTLPYNQVKEYEEILPPKAVGTLVRQLQDTIFESENMAKEFAGGSLQAYADIQRSISRLNDLERDDAEAKDQLGKLNVIPTEQFEQDYKDFEYRIKNLRDKKERKALNRQAAISRKDTAQNNFNELVKKSQRNENSVKYYTYAQELYNWMSSTYDEKEKTTRVSLEQAVTQLFNSIYTGKRKVSIDEGYNIKITPAADAGGVKAIQYFSYVGGLVQLARKAMDEKKDEQQCGGKYPLVLDAAFSHTDREHTKSIAIELSKVTDQLIFAVMDKDWDHVEQDISDRVSKTYRLKRITENEAVIEEA